MPATIDSSRGDRQPVKRGAEVNAFVIDNLIESKNLNFAMFVKCLPISNRNGFEDYISPTQEELGDEVSWAEDIPEELPPPSRTLQSAEHQSIAAVKSLMLHQSVEHNKMWVLNRSASCTQSHHSE
jgi:hypothetical protein